MTLDEQIAALEQSVDASVAERAALYVALSDAREQRDAAAARADEAEYQLSCIADSLGVSADADADLALIVQGIEESVPHYTVDAIGTPATRLEERIDLLCVERDNYETSLAELRAAVEEHRAAVRAQHDPGTSALEAWAIRAKACTVAYDRVTRALADCPPARRDR